jgi:predicted MFS family arabinose efflux permease
MAVFVWHPGESSVWGLAEEVILLYNSNDRMTQAPPSPISQAPSPLPEAPLPGWRRVFTAMRHRNFRLFFWGQLISLIGTWMDKTAEGWLVYRLTGSKVLLGVIAAAGTAPMIVFSFWGGSIADRMPKRSILVATQACAMCLAFTEAFLVWSHLVRPWQIVVLATFGGIIMAFDMPARQSFVIEMTSREDLMNAISLNSSVFNGARLIGPSLAGIIMASLGMAACFFLDGLSFLAVIAGLLMMNPPRMKTPARAVSPLRHALGGLVYVYHDRRLFTLFSLFSVVGVFGWSYGVLMPAWARDVLHVNEAGYGMLLSATGLGALVGALVNAGVGQAMPRRPAVLGGVWLFASMLLLFSMTRVYALELMFLAIGMFGMMIFMSTCNTLVQTSVPDDMRGRVMGVWALLFGGMIPIGSLEAGLLARWMGTPFTVGFGAIVCALAAFVTWLSIRKRPPSTN